MKIYQAHQQSDSLGPYKPLDQVLSDMHNMSIEEARKLLNEHNIPYDKD